MLAHQFAFTNAINFLSDCHTKCGDRTGFPPYVPARPPKLYADRPTTCACRPNAALPAAPGGDRPKADGTMFQEAAAWQKFSPRPARRNVILFLFGQHPLSRNRFPLFSGLQRRDHDADEILNRARRQRGARRRGHTAYCLAQPAGTRRRPGRRGIGAGPPSGGNRKPRRTPHRDRPLRCRAASPSRPASASRIRPCCTPSRRAAPTIDVFTLDTGRHFPETLDTLEASEQPLRPAHPRHVRRTPREVEELVARDGIYGFRLSVETRKACCEVRKVRPLRRALQGAAGWVTGTAARAISRPRAGAVRRLGRGERARQAQPDRRLEPRAARSLHRRQRRARQSAARARLPSIGCQPCTRAIRPGEDIRAGRWWWENEDGKECGLHNRPAPEEAAA